MAYGGVSLSGMTLGNRLLEDDYLGTPSNRRIAPTAAGTTADAPAQAQDLMSTYTGPTNTTYASDASPPVYSSPNVYDPTPAPKTTVSPSTSQAPSVQTDSVEAAISSMMGHGGQAAAPTTPMVTSGTGDPVAAPTPSNPAPTPAPNPAPSTTSTAPSPAAATTAAAFSGDPTSMDAYKAMPTVDDWIKMHLNGTPSPRMTSDGKYNLDDILRQRPDVYNLAFSEYNSPTANDKNSTAWLNRVGGTTPEDYAHYWYDSGGKNEWANMNHTPAAGGGTPTPTGVDGTTTQNPNPTPGNGLGAGNTTGSTSANRMAALNQAIARAKQTVAGRGLKWDDYAGLFNPLYNDIYNMIPDSDTNPNAWFDPNEANNILSGQENQQRNQYRQTAEGLSQHADPHMLDSIITRIMGDSGQQGMDMLNNGLKRGQFNDQGYQGGLSALEKAKAAAQSKLGGYAQDLVSKYDVQLQDVRNRALQAASGYQLGSNFDLTPFQTEDQDILANAAKMSEGDLYNLLGDQPLVSLGDIRMGAGTAQGATNLNDLDVLDAIAKRKSANDVGRGLGSEGTF
jgi:hypothetical protein